MENLMIHDSGIDFPSEQLDKKEAQHGQKYQTVCLQNGLDDERKQKDMCLCGLLSLSLSVHLICCLEVFFSMVLLIQAPDLITTDGSYFYFLGLFEGSGGLLFSLHLTMAVSCVFSALLLYAGSRSHYPRLLFPHLCWQISFIILSIGASIVLIFLGISGHMLLPSSIVLSSMLLVPAICEVWWGYLTLCYFRQLKFKYGVCREFGEAANFRSTPC